jgi:hypothetical protein
VEQEAGIPCRDYVPDSRSEYLYWRPILAACSVLRQAVNIVATSLPDQHRTLLLHADYVEHYCLLATSNGCTWPQTDDKHHLNLNLNLRSAHGSWFTGSVSQSVMFYIRRRPDRH